MPYFIERFRYVKENSLSSFSLSNDLHNLSYLLNNWYTVESFGVNPDCDGVILWFALKLLDTLMNTFF